MNKKLGNVNLRLIASEEVHIRSSVPELRDDNKKGVIYPGSSIELVEEWQGENHKEINKWYRDKNGDFYWSGGFKQQYMTQQNNRLIREDVTYNYRDIFSSFLGNEGKNVRIAILDTGVNIDNAGFNYEIKGFFNAFTQANVVDDKLGHGTHVAGIIGARFPTIEESVLGIAPQSDLYVAKIATEQDVYRKEQFISALEWAINDINADIINMSFQLEDVLDSDRENNIRLKDILDNAVEKDTTLITAAGDGIELTNLHDLLLYPTKFNECITIGSISNRFYSKYSLHEINEKVDYVSPRYNIFSLKSAESHSHFRKGSSMSAAVLSGLASLIISRYGRMPKEELKQNINSVAKKYKEDPYEEDPFIIYCCK